LLTWSMTTSGSSLREDSISTDNHTGFGGPNNYGVRYRVVTVGLSPLPRKAGLPGYFALDRCANALS
jgi:hypothetical protein